jgi:hypothetical protein
MTEDAAYRPKLFYSSGPNQGKEQDFPKPVYKQDEKKVKNRRRPIRR